MNFLRKSLDNLKRPFGKGQKFEKFSPAINAFDTLLFVPNHTTKKGAHIRDAVDLKRTMVTVIIALLPVLIYGIYNTGYQYYIQTGSSFTFFEAFIHGAWKVFPMIIVSYIVGLSIEFGFAVYRGHEVNEGYLVTGLLIPMIMPVDIPLWMVGISKEELRHQSKIESSTCRDQENQSLIGNTLIFVTIFNMCLRYKFFKTFRVSGGIRNPLRVYSRLVACLREC